MQTVGGGTPVLTSASSSDGKQGDAGASCCTKKERIPPPLCGRITCSGELLLFIFTASSFPPLLSSSSPHLPPLHLFLALRVSPPPPPPLSLKLGDARLPSVLRSLSFNAHSASHQQPIRAHRWAFVHAPSLL